MDPSGKPGRHRHQRNFIDHSAAYHRIVERGDDSEEFHNFAGRILLLAMFFLGLGLAGDFFVVVQKISGSLQLASWLANWPHDVLSVAVVWLHDMEAADRAKTKQLRIANYPIIR